MDFNIIKKTTGEAAKYAPYVVELYEKRNGKTVHVDDALNRLSKDAALLNGNKNSHKILLCFETDPYPADDEFETTTREALKILDQNGLEYVICTENAIRAFDDFEQLKQPKNLTLIIKIESIQHDKENENQADEDFMAWIFEALETAFKKGTKNWIDLNPIIDPMLSLQLFFWLYSVVDCWKIGNVKFDSKKDWKNFTKDPKANPFFKTLFDLALPTKYDIKNIDGDPRLLLIAPHGVATHPKDDINTDKLTIKIAKKLKCSAIVNDVISRLYLDFNKVNEASKHKKFISVIGNVLKAPGPTLVVWIHGIDDDNLETEIQKLGVKKDLQCLIGHGQPGKDTANQKTVDDMIRLFKDNSILAHVARVGSKYCGHIDLYMNQWVRLNKYKLKDVESIQLEFKLKGIRSDEDLEASSHNIANALSQLVDFKYHVEQQPTETVESEQSAEEIPVQSKTESSDNLPSIVKKEPEDPLVAEAFEYLKGIFKRHFHEAMLEAGKYIIDTFYQGNPKIAFAKNKTKEQPQSLKKLIEKIQQTSNNPSENVPSTVWVYNAVNLAAHEAICEIEGLQTFVILGHSHKLQLLHVPKLKQIEKNKFDEAIKPAFKEKDDLARVAIKRKLSVRGFKAYIKEQYPDDSGNIDLTKLPSLNELRQRESKELLRLWNLAKSKIDEGQKMMGIYGNAIDQLSIVLAEKNTSVELGKGRYQDWTKSKNNVNICTGCKNDCVYCYMKPMNARNPKLKQPEDWHNWELRQDDVDKNYGLRDGLVGFPSSHDIFPEILDASLTVLGKILRAGNEVLIVSKPRLECIKAICAASPFFKDKILFRFTIGAMSNEILSYWEPNSSTYDERKECLEYAFHNGFRTSVSMEPMLDTQNIEALVKDLLPFISEDIWLGTMNHLDWFKKRADKRLLTELENIEARQRPEMLLEINKTYENNPKIKWKTDALKIIETTKETESKIQKSTELGDNEIYTESEWNGAIASMGRLVDIRNFSDVAADVLLGKSDGQRKFQGSML